MFSLTIMSGFSSLVLNFRLGSREGGAKSYCVSLGDSSSEPSRSEETLPSGSKIPSPTINIPPTNS